MHGRPFAHVLKARDFLFYFKGMIFVTLPFHTYNDLFDSTRVANLVSLVNVVRVSVFYL